MLLSFIKIFKVSAIAGGQHQFPYKEWENELTLLSNELKDTDCDVFWYEWRKNQPPFRAHVIAMHAQSRTNIPTANGYSGQFPSDDWPFTNSSGQNAFNWLSEELAETNHSSKEMTLYPKRCIISIDKKNQASTQHYKKPEKQVPLTILDRQNVKIGEYRNILYILVQDNKKNARTEWVRLIRDGNSIPSRRGSYQITDAIIENGILFITDTNRAARDKYVWEINIETGIFEGQVHTIPGNR